MPADGYPLHSRRRARLREGRDLCLDALRSLPGVTTPSPDGAFYLFPRIEGLTDSFDFCKRLLLETRVGLAPGVAFGAGGEGNVRLCYAVEPRYGVIHDVARKVAEGKAVDLSMGFVNVIWQRDANARAIECLGLAWVAGVFPWKRVAAVCLLAGCLVVGAILTLLVPP